MKAEARRLSCNTICLRCALSLFHLRAICGAVTWLCGTLYTAGMPSDDAFGAKPTCKFD